MVTLRLELEAPSSGSLDLFAEEAERWCAETPGWRIVSLTVAEATTTRCPECGLPLIYDPDLQANACPRHVE